MTDPHFLIALQGGLLLGLIHGVNPCGHSWLVIAPFVAGNRDGGKVFRLTAAFLAGTALACLLIGLSLGAVSTLFTPTLAHWADVASAGIVVALGLILLAKPELLHHHDHDHDNDHDHGHHHDHAHDHRHGRDHHHDHDHGHDHHHDHEDHARARDHEAAHCPLPSWRRRFSATTAGLFAVGFVNMIIPCPTVAIMYSYAIASGSALKACAVFGAYAATTALAVGGVIYALHHMSSWVRGLEKPWLEAALMRGVGLLTVGFGAYTLLQNLAVAA